MQPTTKYWIGVASKEHVARGVAGSFCQLCHGRKAAVARLSPGDLLVYYSPRTAMRAGDVVEAFTALGTVKAGQPYEVDMGDGFVPVRRDVEWLQCKEARIRPLIASLAFIKNKQQWGLPLRAGILEIPASDFAVIAAAMGIELAAAQALGASQKELQQAATAAAEPPAKRSRAAGGKKRPPPVGQ